MNFVIHAYILCTVFQNNNKKWKKKIGCSYRGQTVKIPSINTFSPDFEFFYYYYFYLLHVLWTFACTTTIPLCRVGSSLKMTNIKKDTEWKINGSTAPQLDCPARFIFPRETALAGIAFNEKGKNSVKHHKRYTSIFLLWFLIMQRTFIFSCLSHST